MREAQETSSRATRVAASVCRIRDRKPEHSALAGARGAFIF